MDLKLGQIAQIAYPVSDVPRAVEFFEKTLGLRLVLRPHENMAFFDCGGVSLYVDKASSSDAVSGASILYFKCDDIGGATRTLQDRGVEIVSPPHRVAEMPAYDLWMCFFKDPDSHILALSMHAPKGYAIP
jgi:methylmalonyl-CoA/ethylmalonyl-CoA epimerase